VVARPQPFVAPTEAVLFRGIHHLKPTMLLDETDAIFKDGRGGPSEKQEGLRAILNAGYRKGALVPRCIGTSNELELFDVFCPKSMAGIGHLPQTLEDRAVCIRLTRRTSDEVIERFRFHTAERHKKELGGRIDGWGAFARLNMNGDMPDMPDELDD